MTLFVALLLGIVFGLGLILSGMNDPAKVLGFLDLAGKWDPSLGFVMLGAIALAGTAFQLLKNGQQSWLGDELTTPDGKNIDRPLLLGSALFGIGWGLSGYCPGPALVGLGAGSLSAIAFSISMFFGMEIYHWIIEAQHRHLNRRA